MRAKELAEMLTGRDITEEITSSEIHLAEDNDLVVVFGYSDDNVEFRGAIDDEVGCYGGDTIYITRKGVFNDPDCQESERESCPFYAAAKKLAGQIEAVWHDIGGPCWTFETDIPHETFEIFEDGELWCVGIVFSISDI